MGINMNQSIDWQQVGLKVNKLLLNGFEYFPELQPNVTTELIDKLIEESSKTYQSGVPKHIEYLSAYCIQEKLAPLLFDAGKKLGFKDLKVDDLYPITRILEANDTAETYRGHFDSHIFTLVTPIHIPHDCFGENSGQLVLFNKARREPKNEIENLISKFRYRKYASEDGFVRLSTKKRPIEFNFSNMVPIIFLGRQCFHFNKPFATRSNERRITLLTHFFDPSPVYGVGRLNRLLRGR